MKLVLRAVGRLRPALREVCDDYLRRANRLVTITEVEVREAGHLDGDQRTAEEDRRLLAGVGPAAGITLLDPAGRQWSSEELAVRLDEWRLAARDRHLVIGGAAGFGKAIRDRASETWSLGRITLPHELARVVVAEQIYRAASLIHGMPYHRG